MLREENAGKAKKQGADEPSHGLSLDGLLVPRESENTLLILTGTALTNLAVFARNPRIQYHWTYY
jgi:hypothetical protein